MLACSKLAMKTLPRVWLKTHVKMIASAITIRKKNGEVCEEGSEAGAWPAPMTGRQEVQQMPEAPQDTQEQGTPQWPIARLHAGQREAAPADFLGQRQPQRRRRQSSQDNSPARRAVRP